MYNPTNEEFQNLFNYMYIFEKIYIYDNSSKDNLKRVEEILNSENFEYFFNAKNEGISKPFNFMVKEAQKNKIDYFLLMDQDSKFSTDNINNLINRIEDNKNSKIALFSPNIYFNDNNNGEIKEDGFIDFAITSGCFVDVNIFLEIGGYDENLFIDGVDRDFCLNLKKNDFLMKKISKVKMEQSLGYKNRNLIGVYEHSPIRNYYIYRNRRYVIDKYPEVFKGITKIKSLYLSQLKQIVSIIIFEKDKLEKIRFIKKAKIDYKNNVMNRIRGDMYW
ncbi:glycosyltransferase [Vagococcus fluvialis]|uniref:glycosyltransferase n=1 Tax=Vagococcus fluvialis TaxID=2738 RepID=UPI001A8DA220|nr:glycosyltransferase [Vagococcus fluvialis]MBO0437908.1 glycosyltransferase [Vagococcus fluvialis]